jgi:uncharacterized protein (DUF1800 family)
MTGLSRRKFLAVTGLTAASSTLAACNIGSQPLKPTLQPSATGALEQTQASQTATPTPVTQSKVEITTTPLSPVPADSLPALAVIVLNRLAFGPKPGDLKRFAALGQDDDQRLSLYLEEQLNPDQIEDEALEVRMRDAGFETLGKSLKALYEEHIVNNPYDDNDEKHWQWFIQPADETAEAAFLRAVYSRKQLQEVLADFWHNHFNVYGWHDELAPLFASYDRDVIRANLFGNFRQFLEAVASHPSMLYYLDNRSNSDAGPNENFARELFELHTLGAENYLGVGAPGAVPRDENGMARGYVDNDVYEAARCFTGWRVDDNLWDENSEVGKTGLFLYYRPWHDRFNKLILGQYLPADQPDLADGRAVLDLLSAHPGTARYICRKLCQRLISDDPPEAVVEIAARVFQEAQNAPDQLRQVYRAILSSPEFRGSWGGKMKRPFEQAAAMLRAIGADFVRFPNGAAWTYQMMGQPLFGHHPPDGYADKASFWANTMSTLYGWNLTVGIVQNWWNEEQEGRAVLVDVRSQTPPELRTAVALADFWTKRILGYPLPDETRQAVEDFMAGEMSNQDDLPEDEISRRLPGMVELILMTPEFRMR